MVPPTMLATFMRFIVVELLFSVWLFAVERYRKLRRRMRLYRIDLDMEDVEAELLDAFAALLGPRPYNRRPLHQVPWELPRNRGWYEQLQASYGDEQYLVMFRVSRATFQYIVDSLRPHLQRWERFIASVKHMLACGSFGLTPACIANLCL